MQRPAGARRPRGFALVIVLWTMVLLTLLATQMTGTGRSEVRLAANLRGAAVAQAAADGGVYEAIHQLLATPSGPWPPDPRPRTELVSGASVVIRLGSEDGKFDLNSTPAEVLAALMRAVGVDGNQARELASEIVVWRFPSPRAADRVRAYQQAGLAYGPPGAPFETVAELSLVLGMTRDIFDRLRPHVTVFHEGETEMRAADPIVRGVLSSLGVTDPGPGPARPGRVAVIEADAEAQGGSRASRRAVVRIGSSIDSGGWSILEWQ